MTKAKAWFVSSPGEVYANGPVRFEEPITESEFRQWIRDWQSVKGRQVKRLPAGTQVWPTR